MNAWLHLAYVFTTVLSFIWFILMTLVGNVGLLRSNQFGRVSAWSIIADLFATAWVITFIILAVTGTLPVKN